MRGFLDADVMAEKSEATYDQEHPLVPRLLLVIFPQSKIIPFTQTAKQIYEYFHERNKIQLGN